MTSKNFTYDEFISYIGVSRETHLRLQGYSELLKKWQKTINLVSHNSTEDIWLRHIIDSGQLFDYIAADEAVLDIGSGGGFPGLVLAIMGKKNITLVESDARKVAFLREAARMANVSVSILHKRIETIDIQEFPLITARAFASISELFTLLRKKISSSNKLLLLKGKKYQSEISEAKICWLFDYTVFPSITDKDGVILSIQNFTSRRSL